MHRVLRPGGEATIIDLRKDAAPRDIDAEVSRMGLSRWNALMTRWTFRHLLVKRAYTRDQLEQLVRRSRFGRFDLAMTGLGFDLRLYKD
jgi:hypothetical protein